MHRTRRIFAAIALTVAGDVLPAPAAPLKANTAYSVHIRGAVGGVPFDKPWGFTTGTASAPKR